MKLHINRYKLLAFILMILVVITLAGCDNGAPDSGDISEYEVVIEVKDENTGDALNDVSLTLEDANGNQITADSGEKDGVYQFENVELKDGGQFTVDLSKEGYAEKSIDLVADSEIISLTDDDAVKLTEDTTDDQPEDDVVAKFDDETITDSELDDYTHCKDIIMAVKSINSHFAASLIENKEGEDVFIRYKKEELNNLIDEKLLYQEAKDREIELTEEKKDEIFDKHIEEFKSENNLSDEELLELLEKQYGFDSLEDYKEHFFEEKEEKQVYIELLFEEMGIENQEEMNQFTKELRDKSEIEIYEEKIEVNFSSSSVSDMRSLSTEEELEKVSLHTELQNEEEIVASIELEQNGKNITLDELETEANIQHIVDRLKEIYKVFVDVLTNTEEGNSFLKVYKTGVLDSLITDIILYLEAQNEGLEVTEEEEDEIFDKHIEEFKSENNLSDEELLELLEHNGFDSLEEYKEEYLAKNEERFMINKLLNEQNFTDEEEEREYISDLREKADIDIYEDKL